jgi:hypothetical protein
MVLRHASVAERSGDWPPQIRATLQPSQRMNNSELAHEHGFSAAGPATGFHQAEASMTYDGAKELTAGFSTVRNNTIRIAAEIPEQRYDFKAAPEVRGIRATLAHIALSTMFPRQVHVNQVVDMKTVKLELAPR